MATYLLARPENGSAGGGFGRSGCFPRPPYGGKMNKITNAMILVVMLIAASTTIVFADNADANDTTASSDSEANVAQIGNVQYSTLAEAFEAATELGSETPVEIDLLGNFTGPGVSVQSGTNVILDFNGYTYINNGGVGSTGTETNGFQLLKDSTIVFKNGTLSAVNSPACKILIQNYCNLTLDNMIINAANSTQYAISNNNGSLTITNGTVINASDGYYAFDLYYWPGNGYVNGMKVTLEDGTVNGNVQYGTDNTENASEFYGKAMLRITGGTFNGEISVYGKATSETADIVITGGTFTSDVSKYVSEGYQLVGGMVVPETTDSPVSSDNSDVVVDSETNTVVVPVEGEVSDATVSANVTASDDGTKVNMVYQGNLTETGLMMSATQVAVDDISDDVSRDNLLAVFDLNVSRGTYEGNFLLTVTIEVDVPEGMELANAWVVFYGDNGVEPFDATINGSSITFTTHHTSQYAYYGEFEEEGGTITPPIGWDDDDDYVPPIVPSQTEDSGDDTVTIVACAAAAVVAALLAAFLIIYRRQ